MAINTRCVCVEIVKSQCSCQIILVALTGNSKWVGEVRWKDILSSSREQEDLVTFLTDTADNNLLNTFLFPSYYLPEESVPWAATSPWVLWCVRRFLQPPARELRSFVYIFTNLVSNTCNNLPNFFEIGQQFQKLLGRDRRAQHYCTELIYLGNELKNNSSTGALKLSLRSHWGNWKATWYLNCVFSRLPGMWDTGLGHRFDPHRQISICPGPVCGDVKCDLVTALIVLEVTGNAYEAADTNTHQLRLWKSLVWWSELFRVVCAIIFEDR